MSEVLKNVHGHTTIELTNVHTGEKKIIEDDNTVTNFVDHMLNSAWPTAHPLGWCCRGMFPWFYSTSVKEKILALTKGLMIFDKQISETNNFNYHIPGNVRFIGGGFGAEGSQTGTYSGDCLEYGSWNQNEFIDNSSVEGDRYVQYVWDFATNQANGKINSICLTTRAGGRVGGGSLLWNNDIYQGYNGINNQEIFSIGDYRQHGDWNVNDQSNGHRMFLPHPQDPDKISWRWNDNSHCHTLYYPWYDLDNDILLVTNQTITNIVGMQKGSDGGPAQANSTNYFYNYDNCKNFIDNATGISRPLTIYRYHTKPKQWDIYSNYYIANQTNKAFDHMLIDKKEFLLPENIREELINGYQQSYNLLYEKRVEQHHFLYAQFYYSSRIFATKNYLYQVFKPWTVSETHAREWAPNDYIYIWKIKTDLSTSEVITVENTTNVYFNLDNVKCDDHSRVFVCDNYLFTIDMDQKLWLYSFADDSWSKINDKAGNQFTSYFSYFPQRSFFLDKNQTLSIRGSRGKGNNTDYGYGNPSVIVKPLIKEASILNEQGDYLEFSFPYGSNVNRSDYTLDSRGCYSYLKTDNPKVIFDMCMLGGNINDETASYNAPQILAYNYNGPIITTINNLPEEVEKTKDYTMKVTYRVSWSDPD